MRTLGARIARASFVCWSHPGEAYRVLSFTKQIGRPAIGRVIAAGALAFAAAAGLALPGVARAAGSLTVVGASTTRPSSSATGISGDGSVVVGDSTGDGSNYSAYRWTSGGGTVPLDGFRAQGVSGDGSVIVGFQNDAGGTHAVRWTQATGAVQLGGGTHFANGANEDGSVVVGTIQESLTVRRRIRGRESF
jgi:probable HAF family extracellular repeat protein